MPSLLTHEIAQKSMHSRDKAFNLSHRIDVFPVAWLTVLLNTTKDDKGPQIDVLNTAKYDKGL